MGIAYQYMKASLIRHVKGVDELGNIIEVKMWKIAERTADKPYGYKYSLVYIVNGERVIGYDNAEGRGEHRHYRETERPYRFKSVSQLVADFYDDIEKFKRGEEP
jgi:hypothetical protein